MQHCLSAHPTDGVEVSVQVRTFEDREHQIQQASRLAVKQSAATAQSEFQVPFSRPRVASVVAVFFNLLPYCDACVAYRHSARS
jgi:hypothetical protein